MTVGRYRHPHTRQCVKCGLRSFTRDLPETWNVQQIVVTSGKLIYTCSSKCRREMGYAETQVSA